MRHNDCTCLNHSIMHENFPLPNASQETAKDENQPHSTFTNIHISFFFKEKIASRTLRDKVWKQQVDALRHWIAGKCALLLRNNEAHALMEVGAPVV